MLQKVVKLRQNVVRKTLNKKKAKKKNWVGPSGLELTLSACLYFFVLYG